MIVKQKQYVTQLENAPKTLKNALNRVLCNLCCFFLIYLSASMVCVVLFAKINKKFGNKHRNAQTFA